MASIFNINRTQHDAIKLALSHFQEEVLTVVLFLSGSCQKACKKPSGGHPFDNPVFVDGDAVSKPFPFIDILQ